MHSTSSNPKAKVLVVGSGPSGLVFALSLLKNGVSVRVIEKDSTHHNGERGCGIMPRTLELEHFLGVAEDVSQEGEKWPFLLHMMDPKDPRQIRSTLDFVEFVEPTPSMPISSGITIGQFLHEAIFRRHIEKLGGKVELGSELVGFTQDESNPSKPVTVRIAKTFNGEKSEETGDFDFVIGADGAHSLVRKQMGVDFIGETKEGVKVLLFDAFIHGLGSQRGVSNFGENMTKFVGLRSTTEDGKYQVFLSDPEINVDEIASLPKEENFKKIQELLNTSTGRDDLRLERIVWQSVWRPNMRVASTFRKGRVFIVGDAAHTHSPTGGQGMNSSMQDSFNLAWKISLVVKGLASPSLLDSFNLERLPVIAEMLNLTTDLYNKAFRTAGSPGSAIHDEKRTAEEKQRENGMFREKKLLMMSVNYRWSDLVFDERFPDKDSGTNAYGISGEAVRAGDRAPDAPALKLVSSKQPSTVSRLFDVFNPVLHTALVFAAGPVEARSLLDALKAFPTNALQTALILPSSATPPTTLPKDMDFVFVDAEDRASSGYSVDFDKGTTVIVRPDGIVGAIALSQEAVQKYISGVFARA